MSDPVPAPPAGYSAADTHVATEMLSAVFASLRLGDGATVAFHVDPSAEAVLSERAAEGLGLSVLPLAGGSDRAAVAASIADLRPRVIVVRPGEFVWLSKAAFGAGVGWVFTLGDDRTGSLLERAVRLRGT